MGEKAALAARVDKVVMVLPVAVLVPVQAMEILVVKVGRAVKAVKAVTE